ncbi:Transcription regulator [Spiroplasma clarkii]|uniref:GntR family transcriptional regulator n=1 Tax=Spiroplasma clarkii TaxID=2139 RepID=UPI000B54E78B|nr:GntR family transcriptional regulator [Spiroplasma clarkii]ARU92168.1 Transcription regulator [Spiroplasma clarkii]
MRKIIEEYLLDLISKDKKYVTEPLPSENFLATKFKCSRQTARVELTKLLNKGFIRAVKGSGYYVNPHVNSLKLIAIGNKFKYQRREIFEIDQQMLLKILDENKFINVKDVAKYFGFRKIYYNDQDQPVLYQNSYIYKPLFKEINMDIIKKSLMDFLSIITLI